MATKTRYTNSICHFWGRQNASWGSGTLASICSIMFQVQKHAQNLSIPTNYIQALSVSFLCVFFTFCGAKPRSCLTATAVSVSVCVCMCKFVVDTSTPRADTIHVQNVEQCARLSRLLTGVTFFANSHKLPNTTTWVGLVPSNYW